MEEDKLVSIIKTFLVSFDEFNNWEFPECEYVFTDSIFQEIQKVDFDYAERIFEKTVYGLYFVSKENNSIIYIDNTQNETNKISSIFHETVHMFDFDMLSKYKSEVNIRLLQDDIYFLLWSEFHATFLTYHYLLSVGKNNIDYDVTIKEIENKYSNYLKTNTILRCYDFTDFCLRLFGEIIAMDLIFERTNIHKNCFYNSTFEVIYKFLINNLEFQSFIIHYDEFKNLLESIASVS